MNFQCWLPESLWQVRERLEKHPEIEILSLDSDKRKALNG